MTNLNRNLRLRQVKNYLDKPWPDALRSSVPEGAHMAILIDKTRSHLHILMEIKTLREISNESEINYHWLSHFSSNKLKSCSVDKVEKLYTYLTGKTLDID